MNTTNPGSYNHAVRTINKVIVLIAIGACVAAGTCFAQTVIGTPGAGFQTWNAATDLNNNHAPFWDAPTTAFGDYLGYPSSKNAGWCLISSGDCQGIGSGVLAPGALPFWGMPYNSALDSGGDLDQKVYFKGSGSDTYVATLLLNLSTVPTEVNEFGWFETNSSGTVVGTKHKLFQGAGNPPGSLKPDPIGSTRLFRPTQYFGYYYSDVSEGGCYTYTLYTLNDQDGCATHNFAVFADSSHTTYWIAGEDPPDCNDGDCNLTLVRVQKLF